MASNYVGSEDLLQVLHVVMLEESNSGARQSEAKDDGRMVLLIADYKTPLVHQLGKVEGVCGKTHAHGDGIFNA